MIENAAEILEKYPIKVFRTYRGRGALCCETENGIKLLKEFESSKSRAENINYVLKLLIENGYPNVDSIIENCENFLFSYDSEERVYILKNWFEGSECDTKSLEDVIKTVIELAKLHNYLNIISDKVRDIIPHNDYYKECKKRNCELKHVKNFIYKKRKKTDFELCFLRNYNYFMEQAINSTEYLGRESNNNIPISICHGNFNHHNVIIGVNRIAVTNFDKMCYDVQILDLYDFLRKIMEKYNWNINVGLLLVDTYRKYRNLTKAELINLYRRLNYPEKFWKISNQYYNSNKAWVSEKIVSKMKKIEEQEYQRSAYLKAFREWIEF